MIGIQDQVLSEIHIKREKNKQISVDAHETIEPILSSYQILPETKYLSRHNKVAAIIYLKILMEFKIAAQNEVSYYKFNPP